MQLRLDCVEKALVMNHQLILEFGSPNNYIGMSCNWKCVALV